LKLLEQKAGNRAKPQLGIGLQEFLFPW